MSNIDTLVFDVGGVLLDWDPEYLYEELIPNEMDRDAFLFNVCTFKWHAQTDAGRSFAEIIEEKKAEFSGQFDQLIEAWWLDWDEMCGGIFEGTFDLAQMVRQRFPDMRVVGITNFSDETWPRLLKLYPIFADFFDDVVVSGAEKMVKPDPEIYQLAIERFNLAPARSLFIDDKQDNIDAAINAGMQGHLFESSQALAEHFEKIGLID